MCKKMGGYLATPNDEEENSFLGALLRNTGTDRWYYWEGWTWFGMYSNQPWGPWFLVDGKELSFSNWGQGEPNNGLYDEKCVTYITNGYNQDDQWNDYRCSRQCFWVCERDTCHDVPD
ncbi:lectin C-type domain protein [Ancylostoma caninum]|uniref:Lectin C-type domain protein n=1 Tax=Ancylostoma caninum TaxID=29170 RepID=A0A368F048_ANCCA|nr:lectin C-type domain protein [Ancylostoma caninum]